MSAVILSPIHFLPNSCGVHHLAHHIGRDWSGKKTTEINCEQHCQKQDYCKNNHYLPIPFFHASLKQQVIFKLYALADATPSSSQKNNHFNKRGTQIYILFFFYPSKDGAQNCGSADHFSIIKKIPENELSRSKLTGD